MDQEKISADNERESLKDTISAKKAEGERETRRKERLEKEIKVAVLAPVLPLNGCCRSSTHNCNPSKLITRPNKRPSLKDKRPFPVSKTPSKASVPAPKTN